MGSIRLVGVLFVVAALGSLVYLESTEVGFAETRTQAPDVSDSRVNPHGPDSQGAQPAPKPADALGDLKEIPVRDTTPSYPPPPLENPQGVAPNNQPDIPLGNVGGFNFDEPLLRVNPTNPANIVVTSHRGILTSTDSGATWFGPTNYPNALGGNGGDTGMTFDSQGRLFWTTLVNRPMPSTVRALQFMEINPTTRATIQAPLDLQVASGDPNPNSEDKEYIVADEYPGSPFTDNLYVIWTKLSGSWSVLVTTSTDNGATWSLPLTLSNGIVDNQPWPSDIAVAPNGDVYAAYHSGGAAGATGFTSVLRSTDGGVSFPQKTSAFTAGQSDVSTNVVGQAGAIPGLQFWMLGSGQPWVLPDPARAGNVYVVTNDDPDNAHGTNGDDADVVFARSTDNGNNWAVTTIPDGSGGAHQIFPFAAIDQFGNIAVAWFDTRRGQTNGFGNLLLDVFATYSTDGGLTWAPAFMVNDANNPFDPDFPNNQRRFPTPQQTPCAKTMATNTETCRIGEYFGIDIDRGAVYLTWIGNTYDMVGNVAGDQLWFDSFWLPTDLSISKTDGQASVVAGEQLTYTVTVDNNGAVDAGNVTVVDTLPTAVSYVSSTVACVESPTDTLTCDLGTLTPSEQVQFDIVVDVGPGAADGAVLTNQAVVSANNPDTDGDNDTATDDTSVTRVVDIVITKEDDFDPIVADSGVPNGRYTVTAMNKGPSNVTDLVVSDILTLPPNVTLHEVNPLSGSWNDATDEWTVSVQAGAQAFLVVFVTVPLEADEADVITNTASVVGSGGGESIINTDDDSDTEVTAIRWPTANWDVFKEYTDGGAGPVDVRLECSEGSGLAFGNPGEDTTPAALQWRRFDIGETQCSVIEEVPGGYYELERTEDCDVDDVEDIDQGGNYACTITNAPTRATFTVQKLYMDGNIEAQPELNISCNTGLPLDQSRTADLVPGPLGSPQTYEVKFVVTEFDDGELDCVVWETGKTGYHASYNCNSSNSSCTAGGPSGIPDDVFFEGPCQFDDVVSLLPDDGPPWHNLCVIRNYAEPVAVDVTKEWIFIGEPSGVDTDYELTLYCDAEIVGGQENCPAGPKEGIAGGNGTTWCTLFEGDDTEVFSADVIPQWPSSHCWVDERVFDNAVEIENGCTDLEISAGEGTACVVTNTVFFEGIPALGRYGQLLMVLVLLLAGLVVYRRP
ncbi:hypothetical protein [Elongatibacter sediminis]|uniref:DUF11 domain-containing protein n=1 Tax=Elongatibacter sediminis TaxID=3119006 RepID=A0AAW9RC20_9GAMM